MQTLRKKSSPLKYKNETTRFLGDGVSFKAKLIGILEVSEARGDRMCQEALSDLKMAIRAAGEHKQRITINIAIDGLRLRDEKTGDSLYHHPVHKISFIAQDMTDSRAFGYIFGSPDTGHRFFGIKTDKAASQVVIAMRDLFQVVFALKKKEIELAKQHLEKTCYPSSPLFSDSSSSSSKLQSVPNVSIKSAAEAKSGHAGDLKSSGTAVADLVDLELELNSLQQGLNQMERITPSDPFGTKDDPFGDSFISYPMRPILPPPPSSGKERSSRTSDSSIVFSPKTPHTNISVDASDKKKEFSFTQESNSGDWFTPSIASSIFEEPSSLPDPPKDDKHEQTKQEILSQFDVFTELDPLELKNPPKKALNDLVVTTNTTPEPSLSHHRNAEKAPPPQSTQATAAAAVFTLDPFGEDPFVTEDPFADSDFSKQDPFAAEFGAAFPVHLADDAKKDELQSFVHNSLCKSPRALEKQISLSVSPKAATSFARPTTTFDVLSSRENPSFDASSEGECAPEPPPRPPSNVLYIKPPPLPPKKQSNDMSVKPPPPRPHYVPPAYDFLDKYESVVEQVKSPPLPVPARKARFDAAPERPRKHFGSSLSEEDYLTPISLPEKGAAAVLLPPPQKTSRKVSEPATKTNAAASLESTCDGLDITLSQLTLSGLNELARKLHIPPGQLSNMTLVQLTSYLSNYIKSSSNGSAGTATVQPNAEATDTFAPFHADFASNFSNCTTSDAASTYDRYAVFRELMEEEIKQTKIDGEPEELLEKQTNDDAGAKPSSPDEVAIANSGTDKYAALREIVERELKHSELSKEIDDIAEEEEEEPAELQVVVNGDKEIDVIVKEDSLNNNNGGEVQEKEVEYVIEKETEVVAVKLSTVVVKSPVPSAVTDIVQNSARLTSGSLSDVVSGSSPEIDNTASNSDVGKKAADAAGESWAIFDQATIPLESVDEKQAIQSEEGVSPWSSDSKEFGNGSPPGWRRSKDSGSGAEQYVKKRRDHDGWWDTSADPEVNYCASNRRSTDSYDEEYYECYDRPRRRKQQTGSWQHGGKGSTAAGHSSSSRDVSPWEEEQQQQQSRRRELREVRAAYRHARGPSFERHRDRRLTDSWDEEDDYEYDEDHPARIHRSGRHSARDADLDSRHNVVGRDHESSDRWCEDRGEERRHRRRRDARDRWCCPEWEQTENEKPPRYGGGSGGSRWTTTTSSSAEAGVVKWRERYYSRESQESPWEDEYANEAEASPHFVTKRNWKRPSSASEMDRKTGEIKSRHHLGTGGSDGERADRRYKSGRRSRSRDSHYSEPSHRHKQDAGPSLRNVYRTKPHSHPKSVDGDFSDTKKPLEVKLEKKMSSMSRKKPKDSPKGEENIVVGTLPRKSPGGRGKLLFENDFVSTSESPASAGRGAAARFNFDNDFETSEAESPVSLRPVKTLRQQTMFEKNSPPVDRERQRGGSLRESPRYQKKARSHFEDDFSPVGVDRAEPQPQLLPEDGTISSIKEEVGNEDDDEFGASNFEKAVSGRMKILSKNRLSAALRSDVMKKSESVNIFARDDDPFDDEFFCGEELDRDQKRSPRSCELRWTEDFEN